VFNYIAQVPWQLAVIATGILSAIAQSIGKRQVTYMSAFQSGLLRDLTIFSIIAIIFVSQGTFSWSPLNFFFVAIGILESIMMAAYYSASRQEMAATSVFSYPFSSILIIITSGFLFGEWKYFDFTTTQGIANIATTILTLILISNFQNGKIKLSSWNIKLILSATMVAGANIVQKWAIATIGLRPAGYMIYEYAGLIIGGIIFVYGRKLNLKLTKKDFVWGIFQGILFAISILWYGEILRTYPLSLSSIIRRIAIVLGTTFAGLIIFGEHKSMSKSRYIQMFIDIIILVTTLFINN